jgi:long-chain acyl-CoA synthetase
VYTFALPLDRALATAAGSCAVVCQDNRRTYAELVSRCRRLAGALRAQGLVPGDRVGVIGLNSDRYLELYLGVPAAGFVLVPVNSRLAPAEMRAILADAGVSVLFADTDYPGAADVKRVLTLPGDYEDLIAAASKVGEASEAGEANEARPAENDLAALFYTSGTTGAAKGAMHTHRSLVTSALHFMATWSFDRQTRWMIASPMFHTGGIIGTLATVWAGGTHVIMPRFDPDLAVDLIEREGVTHTLLVPTMLAAAANAQLARPRDVSSLRYLSHGASPISAETLRRARQAFPQAELLHVYGTTEATPITTLLPHEELIIETPRVRSCGQPATGVEVRIVDSALAEVKPGTVGDILVRSASVMAGYWRKPEATAEVMRGDWYLTGDLGYRDDESYLYLVDRAKDMIVSGGENIYSTEVEDALASHPAVEEVAVFGVPDPRWGESVYAVVVTRQPVTADELVDHCRQRIAGFKVPRHVELLPEPLPKSAAGKILKRQLREPHWAGQQAYVSGG